MGANLPSLTPVTVVFPLLGRALTGPVPVSFRSDGHVTPRFNASDGALLFHLLCKLYERTNMVITTNPRLSKWAAVFGDARMTTTLLDRLTHRCHILETGTTASASWQAPLRHPQPRKRRKQHTSCPQHEPKFIISGGRILGENQHLPPRRKFAEEKMPSRRQVEGQRAFNYLAAREPQICQQRRQDGRGLRVGC